jgi:succinoglycan biosynthesis transport protein ExoP
VNGHMSDGQPGRELMAVPEAARPALPDTVVGEYYGQAVRNPAAARAFWRLLRRQWGAMLCTVGLILGGGALWVLSRPPLYRATAEVLVTPLERGQTSGPLLADKIGVATRVRSVATEVRLLKSPDLLDAAFAHLPHVLRVAGFHTQARALPRYPLTVENPSDTDVITVAVTAHTPVAAATFANKILAIHRERQQTTLQAMAASATRHVDAELLRCTAGLTQAWEEMAAFKRQHQIVDLPTQTAADAQGLAALRTQITSAHVELDRARVTRQLLAQQLERLPETIVTGRTAAENPLVQTIEGDIERLQQQRTTLLQDYLPAAPEVKHLEAQLAEAIRRKESAGHQRAETVTTCRHPLRDTLTQSYVTALVNEQDATSRLRITQAQSVALRARMDTLPASEQRLAILTSRIAELQASHAYLVSQKQALDLGSRGGLPSVLPFTRARPNPQPVSPNLPASFALLLVLSVGAAVAVAVVREGVEARVTGVEELEGTTGLRVLASIPRVCHGFQGLVTEAACPPRLLESFRLLRANVLLALDPFPSVLMVTSARAGEGKSTTVANLGATLALSGRRVLLIDGDLRQPALHREFGLGNECGLTSVLEGAALPACIQATPLAGVSVLPSGPLPAFPPELLESPALKTLLAELRGHYDCILVDSPPLIQLSDGLALAQLAEGAVVVVAADQARHPDLLAAVRALDQTGIPVLGLVYNRSDELPTLKWQG